MITTEEKLKRLAEIVLLQDERIETLTTIVLNLAVKLKDANPEADIGVCGLISDLDRLAGVAELAARPASKHAKISRLGKIDDFYQSHFWRGH